MVSCSVLTEGAEHVLKTLSTYFLNAAVHRWCCIYVSFCRDISLFCDVLSLLLRFSRSIHRTGSQTLNTLTEYAVRLCVQEERATAA